jgi:uncharacterized protein YkwD
MAAHRSRNDAENGLPFTFQPRLICNKAPFSLGVFMRAWAAIFVTLSLAGCASEAPVEKTPAMYIDLATPDAKIDPAAAASMISQYRANNGLGPVTVDPALMQLAETQASAMAAANKLDHDARAPVAKRLTGEGYPTHKAVENVSAGYHTLAEAFSGWRDSPPHRANMLAGDVTKLGIAASYAPNTKYKVFWTLILAKPGAV